MKRASNKVLNIPLAFRLKLSRLLLKPRGGNPQKSSTLVGEIRHEGGVSEVRINNFENPLKIPPSVDCGELWVRKSNSWHYETHRSRFCWVLSEEWERHFQTRLASGESPKMLCDDAAIWLIKAVSIVLSRHWVGYETGLFEWPDAWQDYSHGQKGVDEFLAGTFRKV